MKNNKYIYITNWLLLFSIPFMLITVNVKTDTINSNVDTKNLKTSLFETVIEKADAITQLEDEIEKKDTEINNDTIEDNSNEKTKKEEEPKEVVVEQPVVKEETQQEEKSDVLETFMGNLSYYRANCSGCSGFTATGLDVRDGKLFYNDSTYGNVRIVAAGTEIPKYSIVRIKNSSFGSEVLAIVLDRGGNIGQGKKFIVDILTNSIEAKGGVDYGVSIELIRKGK